MSFFWITLEASRISISRGCPLAVRWTLIPSAMSRESEGLPSRNLIIKTSASREYFIFIETSTSETRLISSIERDLGQTHSLSSHTSTFREFSKRRNDLNRHWATRLLLLLTNPKFPQSSAEATEEGRPSRVFGRQRISGDRIQQFINAAIGEGMFGQIRREIRSEPDDLLSFA